MTSMTLTPGITADRKMDALTAKFHDDHIGEMPLGPDGKTRQYYPWFCHMLNLIDGRAHGDCECHWRAPYGWVVEAGCPDHD